MQKKKKKVYSTGEKGQTRSQPSKRSILKSYPWMPQKHAVVNLSASNAIDHMVKAVSIYHPSHEELPLPF